MPFLKHYEKVKQNNNRKPQTNKKTTKQKKESKSLTAKIDSKVPFFQALAIANPSFWNKTSHW